jgi:hypothetical protein
MVLHCQSPSLLVENFHHVVGRFLVVDQRELANDFSFCRWIFLRACERDEVMRISGNK